MSLTQAEFSNTQVFVQGFFREDELTRTITFKVVYDGEVSSFSTTITAKKNQTKEWFVERAFKRLRRQIRQWVKSESQTGGIVGQQFSFSFEDFNADDADDNADP